MANQLQPASGNMQTRINVIQIEYITANMLIKIIEFLKIIRMRKSCVQLIADPDAATGAILICQCLFNLPRALAPLVRARCVPGKRYGFARVVYADVPSSTARSALVITKVNAAVYYPVCYRLQGIR